MRLKNYLGIKNKKVEKFFLFGYYIYIANRLVNNIKYSIMRKFKIRIDARGNKDIQTIFADDKDKALGIAKVNLGFKENDILLNWSREFYNDNLEDLKFRCELVKDKDAIEVVELWVGEESHLEILRTDGYYDSIFFEDKDKADEVYNILKVYNRDITPLEKYHASF